MNLKKAPRILPSKIQRKSVINVKVSITNFTIQWLEENYKFKAIKNFIKTQLKFSHLIPLIILIIVFPISAAQFVFTNKHYFVRDWLFDLLWLQCYFTGHQNCCARQIHTRRAINRRVLNGATSTLSGLFFTSFTDVADRLVMQVSQQRKFCAALYICRRPDANRFGNYKYFNLLRGIYFNRNFHETLNVKQV